MRKVLDDYKCQYVSRIQVQDYNPNITIGDMSTRVVRCSWFQNIILTVFLKINITESLSHYVNRIRMGMHLCWPMKDEILLILHMI